MHFFTLVISAISLAAAVVGAPGYPDHDGHPEGPAFQSQATFAFEYNKDFPLGNTACGDRLKNAFHLAPNARIGDLSSFPFVGAVFQVSENINNCGTCWKLTYKDKEPIYILAIDKTNPGFTLSKPALDKLAPGNNNVAIPITAQQVSTDFCFHAW